MQAPQVRIVDDRPPVSLSHSFDSVPQDSFHTHASHLIASLKVRPIPQTRGTPDAQVLAIPIRRTERLLAATKVKLIHRKSAPNLDKNYLLNQRSHKPAEIQATKNRSLK